MLKMLELFLIASSSKVFQSVVNSKSCARDFTLIIIFQVYLFQILESSAFNLKVWVKVSMV